MYLGRQTVRWAVFTVLLAVVGSSAVACAESTPNTPSGTGSGSGRPNSNSTLGPTPSSSPTSSDLGTVVRRLAPAQLAGQRLIYSYHGLTPPAYLLDRIRAGRAAGVIVFAHNVASAAQLRAAAAQLQRAAAQSPVKLPLLIMTDQEGGLVRRLPGAPLRSERQIGLAADPLAAATQAGRSGGLNLRAAGLNVDLAPVLDVSRRPGDFIDLFGRSYGEDPARVARLGAAFITSMQGTVVAATAKHFPGLGAATAAQNTDKRPVVLRQSLPELRTVDEPPFAAAVAAGVRLVMVSWARYPALDASLPAGLSPTIVQGELRRRLDFTGVTITDSLGAKALEPFGDPGQRAVLAAQAGMDLLLCGRGPGAQRGLAAALRTGRLDRSACDASVLRVLRLRQALTSAGAITRLSSDDRDAISRTIRAYFAAINDRRFHQAWLQLSPAMRTTTSAAHLAESDSTTQDSAVVVRSMTPVDAATAVAYVTFTSTQAASQGPDGDTRDDWTLDYTMTRIGGRWFIDRVAAHNGSTHTTG